MNLAKMVAINGMGGIYKVAVTRKDGLIVEDYDTGKKRFLSSRKYQPTPLETISIYIDGDDTIELKDIFQTMLEQIETNPLISSKTSSEDTRSYFEKILPNYDKERVYVSDIKKVVKWFSFLQERDLLSLEEESTTETEETEVIDTET